MSKTTDFYADRDNIKYCDKILKESKTTDKLVIKSDEEYNSILQYGHKVSTKDIYEFLPDIIIADTIPVKDLMIKIQHIQADVRFVVDNNKLIIHTHKQQDRGCGKVILLDIIEIDGQDRMAPAMFYITGNGISYTVEHFNSIDDKEFNNFLEKETENAVDGGLMLYVLWYSIQLALLNPVVRNMVKVTGNDAVNVNTRKASKNKNKTKRVIKYVKRIEIDINALKEYNESRIYRRSMTLWHVTGHYRQYKNGSRIFIKPYWKGSDRNNVKDVETIERRIVVE